MENQKQTLQEILRTFQDLDDGIIELSKAEIEDLKGSLNLKVDGYHEIISRYEAESERLRSCIDQLAAQKKYAYKAVQRIKEIMLYNMKASGSTKLQGDVWTASIKKSQAVKAVREPSEEDLMEVPSSVLKIKYSWSLAEAKKLIGKNEVIDALFEIEERDNLNFKPRKDVE